MTSVAVSQLFDFINVPQILIRNKRYPFFPSKSIHYVIDCKTTVILSDSTAAMQGIASTSCPKMGKIKEIYGMIQQIQNFVRK